MCVCVCVSERPVSYQLTTSCREEERQIKDTRERESIHFLFRSHGSNHCHVNHIIRKRSCACVSVFACVVLMSIVKCNYGRLLYNRLFLHLNLKYIKWPQNI